MKQYVTVKLILGLSIFVLANCNNSNNGKHSEKELDLQKKELDLKQKELELKEKQIVLDSIQKSRTLGSKINSTLISTKSENQIKLNDKPFDLRKQLAIQLIQDAYNPEWFKQCITDAGGIDKVVNIKKILLNNAVGQQYLLEGMPPCAFGARTPMYWIYENKDGKIRLLANIGAADNVTVSSKKTNGYYDILLGAYFGDDANSFHWKFNGRKYKQVD